MFLKVPNNRNRASFSVVWERRLDFNILVIRYRQDKSILIQRVGNCLRPTRQEPHTGLRENHQRKANSYLIFTSQERAEFYR